MPDVLEGVTILSEGTGYVITLAGTIVYLCSGIFALSVVISFIVVAANRKSYDWVPVIVTPALVAVALLTISIVSFATRYPVYKVTVDKNVSFVEFNERYEIIKQDGLIYEVKERSK